MASHRKLHLNNIERNFTSTVSISLFSTDAKIKISLLQFTFVQVLNRLMETKWNRINFTIPSTRDLTADFKTEPKKKKEIFLSS